MKFLYGVLITCTFFLLVAAYQGSDLDEYNRLFWLSPYDITTLTADTEIDSFGGIEITAITPETDVEFYYGTDTTNDFLLEAGTTLTIKKGVVVKLKTNTVCLVY